MGPPLGTLRLAVVSVMPARIRGATQWQRMALPRRALSEPDFYKGTGSGSGGRADAASANQNDLSIELAEKKSQNRLDYCSLTAKCLQKKEIVLHGRSLGL